MKKRTRLFAAIVFFSLVTLTPLAISFPTKLTYNPSPSSPIGFYWIEARGLERGAFVVVPTPPDYKLMAAERRYIPINVDLIKRVYALTGDKVCREKNDIFVNGKLVARALVTDKEGRLLPVWQGCTTLNQDQFFAMMDAPDSFDGRYFGPLNKGDVIGIATPVFTWSRDDSEKPN